MYGPSDVYRFSAKVKYTKGCWEWVGNKTAQGYGIFIVAGKPVSAHRWSFSYYNSAIKEGMHVLHSCNNPGCVNPKHLSQGTHNDNMQDMIAKGRNSRIAGAFVNKDNIHDLTEIIKAGANVTQLAKDLGVAKSTLYDGLRKKGCIIRLSKDGNEAAAATDVWFDSKPVGYEFTIGEILTEIKETSRGFAYKWIVKAKEDKRIKAFGSARSTYYEKVR